MLDKYLRPNYRGDPRPLQSPLAEMFAKLLPGEQPECVIFWDFVGCVQIMCR